MNRVFRQITLAEAVQLIQEENIENLYFRDKEELEDASPDLVRLVDEELLAENIIYVDWFLEEKADEQITLSASDLWADPSKWIMSSAINGATVTYQ